MLKIFDVRKDFVWLYQKSNATDFDELQINNSSHTKGTYYLSSKRVNGHQMDGFSSVGAQTGAIKLICNGWYLGLVAPVSSIARLLILYSKNVLSP